MNIVVRTYSGRTVVRPDTTWKRLSEDLFLPDSVRKLSYTPVLFAHISRAGRAVGRHFAGRYYDSFNYGILLYPEDWIDGSPEGFAAASCLNHTSMLSEPLRPMEELGGQLEIHLDHQPDYSVQGHSRGLIEQALCEATQILFVRRGDLVAIELAPRKLFWDRDMHKGPFSIQATYAAETLLDFQIIPE